MSKNLDIGMELLFVRHENARMRSDVSRVGKILRRPFKDFGSTDFDSSDESTFLLPKPMSERIGLLVGRFPKQPWFSVSSNTASIKQILAFNAQIERLEFARLRYDRTGKLAVLEVLKGGEPQCRCEMAASPKEILVNGNTDLKKAVAKCANTSAAAKKLREYFHLGTALKSVVQVDNLYSVIDEKGRELKPSVCALLILDGPKLTKKTRAVTAAARDKKSPKKMTGRASLPAALARLDADEVRAAIAQGASPVKKIDSKSTPLRYVILRFESPGARECAQALIEGGAKVGDLLAECCSNLYFPEHSLARVQFLIDHGGDVNVPSSSGVPAIYTAASQRYMAVVKLLMKHGANPHTTIPHLNVTTVEWAKDQLGGITAPDQKQVIADILTELTGAKVSVPQAEPLSKELMAENNRFLLALQAKQLRAFLPDEFTLKDSDENKLRNNPEFNQFHKELLEESFQQNGLRFEVIVEPMFIVTYTNERRQMDAVVSDRWWSKEVGCRIIAYGSDGKLFSVGNFSHPEVPNFDPDFVIRGEHLRCRPRKLIDELVKLIKQNQAKLLPTPSAAFSLRYQSSNDRILAATKQWIEEVLNRGAICDAAGHPLRFERRRLYLNFSGFRDREYSSRHMAERALKDIFSKRPKDESDHLASVVCDCFTLLAMQHLQYAGVSPDRSFLRKGCDAGIELFQKLKTTWKKDLSMGLMKELGFTMLMCQISGDDSRLRKLCDSVQSRMMTEELRTSDDPLAMGQAFLSIVSHFRTRAVPQLTAIKKQVLQAHSQRAKTLLNACDSLARSDGKSLTTHLRQSLGLFAAQNDPNPSPNYLLSKFAIPESILFDAGRKSCRPDDIPIELADLMITK